MMNKDDILAKSRAENKNKDLYVEDLYTRAGALSSFISSLLTTVFFVLQIVIKNEFNFGLYAIVFSFGATNFIVLARHTKRRRDLILAILYSIATVGLTAAYIYQLLATSAVG